MLVALGQNTVTFASSSIPIGEAINITLCLAPHTTLVLPHDMLQTTAVAVAETLEANRMLFIPPDMPHTTATAVTQALGPDRILQFPPHISQPIYQTNTERPTAIRHTVTNKAKKEIKAGVSALLGLKHTKRNRMFQEKDSEQAARPKKNKKTCVLKTTQKQPSIATADTASI